MGAGVSTWWIVVWAGGGCRFRRLLLRLRMLPGFRDAGYTAAPSKVTMQRKPSHFGFEQPARPMRDGYRTAWRASARARIATGMVEWAEAGCQFKTVGGWASGPWRLIQHRFNHGPDIRLFGRFPLRVPQQQLKVSSPSDELIIQETIRPLKRTRRLPHLHSSYRERHLEGVVHRKFSMPKDLRNPESLGRPVFSLTRCTQFRIRLDNRVAGDTGVNILKRVTVWYFSWN